MTSSVRGVIQRDFGRHEYKEYAQNEPGLISILFLALGKSDLTRVCFNQLVRSTQNYTGELEWLFYEGGDTGESLKNLKLFSEFKCERKKIIYTNENWGINIGFNDLWAISRGEYCVEMESDWFNVNPDLNWLDRSKEILHETEAAIVQLRSIDDPNENWGYGKEEYHPWSCGKFDRRKLTDGHEYLMADNFFSYNHNPNMIYKYKRIATGILPEPIFNSDPKHGETLYQQLWRSRVGNRPTAHINVPLFQHVGGALRHYYESLC